MKWEYETHYVTNHEAPESLEGVNYVSNLLDALGKRGMELVTVTDQRKDDGQLILYFKKPLREPAKKKKKKRVTPDMRTGWQ